MDRGMLPITQSRVKIDGTVMNVLISCTWMVRYCSSGTRYKLLHGPLLMSSQHTRCGWYYRWWMAIRLGGGGEKRL